MVGLKNPITTNGEFIRNYTVSVDGSNVYPDITVPSGGIDFIYGAIQIEFRAIREAGSGIDDSQDYFLYGGRLPYNVYAVGNLPEPVSGIFPSLQTSLVASGETSVPTMSGYIFKIDTISGDTEAYRIELLDNPDFGITRFEFYDFEGERREAIDFILNAEVRNVSGIAITDIEIVEGSSIDLSYYAGLAGDENRIGQSKITPIEWDVDNGVESVVGSGVSFNTVFGPNVRLTGLVAGSYTLTVSREQEASPEQSSPYLLRDHIISEGVSQTLSETIPLEVLPSTP